MKTHNSHMDIGFVLRRILSVDFNRLHIPILDTKPIPIGDSVSAIIVLYFILLTERKCVHQRVFDNHLRRLYMPGRSLMVILRETSS